MKIHSAAFGDGAEIPREHTCDGGDVSPPLAWEGVPGSAAALALVVDDPDAPAGLWTHWLVWNLDPASGGLPAAVGPGSPPGGGVQGANSWGNALWQGPCPPSGSHRYFFRLYALDEAMALSQGASRDEVDAALEGHVLAQAETMGRYARMK